MANLLASKLRRPSIPPRYIARPELTARLTAGLAAGRQVTLVSAPAGFGKTTCVCAWLQALDQPVAWLSLEPADDDPARFFPYLVAALQSLDPAFGQEVEPMLRAGQALSAEGFGAGLMNDLQKITSPAVLAIDDLHVIQDEAILRFLEQLIANLPAALHLVLLTREDPSLPLARLRANNRLSEIRAAELRFSPTDVERFMAEVMDLALSPADLAVLAERTEGWAAGLQLAGLSMRGRADPSDFIAHLSGSQRFILSYLTEEVLNHQSEEVQAFLLRTSILERMNAELCEEILEERESRVENRYDSRFSILDSRSVLDYLERANLFLVALDDEGRWYRYHHLFAELLRSRLNAVAPGMVAELHRRACRWYARAAEAAARPDEQVSLAGDAVRHACLATDYESAVGLIEKFAPGMLLQWYAKTVSAWLQAIPPAWSLNNPKANLVFAWTHLMRYDPAQAAPYLERLRAIFAAPHAGENPAIRAEWLALQATIANAQGLPDQSLAFADEALAIVPQNDDYTCSQVYLAQASAYQQLDDSARAAQAYQNLIQHGRAAGNLVLELTGLSALSLMVIERGELRYGFELAWQAAQRAEPAGYLPLCMGIYGELGQIYYAWYQLDEAERYFRRGAQLSAASGFSDAEAYHAVVRARLALAQGDVPRAAGEMEKAEALAREETPVVVREEIIGQQVRVALAQGQLAKAEAALAGEDGLDEFDPARSMPYARGMLYTSYLRLLLYRGRENGEYECLPRGVALASRLIEFALRRPYLAIALEALLLRAQMRVELNQPAAAREDLAAVVTLAEPENFVCVFLEAGPQMAGLLTGLLEVAPLEAPQADFLRRVLSAFGAPRAEKTTSDLVEPLTAREMEVLRLMAEGLKYGQIAERLFISLNTVRTYVKEIYGKLAVDNRTKAIAAARTHKLIQ